MLPLKTVLELDVREEQGKEGKEMNLNNGLSFFVLEWASILRCYSFIPETCHWSETGFFVLEWVPIWRCY